MNSLKKEIRKEEKEIERKEEKVPVPASRKFPHSFPSCHLSRVENKTSLISFLFFFLLSTSQCTGLNVFRSKFIQKKVAKKGMFLFFPSFFLFFNCFYSENLYITTQLETNSTNLDLNFKDLLLTGTLEITNHTKDLYWDVGYGTISSNNQRNSCIYMTNKGVVGRNPMVRI